MKNLPIDVLRSFVTVCQVESFTQSAQQLGRTQSAISQQIRKLEDRFDQQFFVRSANSFTLTEQGKRLYDYAVEILALNDMAIKEFDREGITGSVKLGIPSEFATAIIPKVIHEFRQTHPQISLEVVCALSKTLLHEDSKLESDFDLMLVLKEPVQPEDCDFIKKEPLIWVGSPLHTLKSVDPLPLVLAPAPCIYRKRVETKLRQQKINWNTIYTIQDLYGIQCAIEEGIGFTVLAKSTMPTSLIELKNDERLPELGEVGIYLKHMKKTPNEAATLLADKIRQRFV